MNISPLPWRNDGTVVYDADNNVVVFIDDLGDPEAIANAEMIAKAVSLYAEMADTINRIAQCGYGTRSNSVIDMARHMNRKIKEF